MQKETVVPTQDELIEALDYVLKLNPKVALSGTFALRMQCKFFPNRPVHDLDFELPYGIQLQSDKQLIDEGEGDEYFGETHTLLLAKYKNVSLNFFQAISCKDEITDTDTCWINAKKYKCVWYLNIIEKKLEIALQSNVTEGKIKHAKDLIEILTVESLKPIVC